MWSDADTVKSGVLDFCDHDGGVMGDHCNVGVSVEYKGYVLMERRERKEGAVTIHRGVSG